MFKNIIRERMTSILLIIGFSLSFFVAINGINIINRLISIRNNEESSRYLNEVLIHFDKKEGGQFNNKEVEQVLEELKQIDNCNIVCNDYGYVYGMQISIDYILESNETIAMKLKEGRYATEEEREKQEKVIIISEELKKYQEIINGVNYITIGSAKYKVIGVLEKISDDYSENLRAYIYMDTLEEGIYKSYINKNTADGKLVITMSSNHSDLSKEIEYINSFKDKYDVKINIYEVEMNDITNLTMSRYMEKVYMIILVFFVMVNCILVSDIWIERRLNEFVIRKAYGMSLGKMILAMLKQISPLLLMALVLSIIIEILYVLITKTSIEKIYLSDILYLFGAVIIIVMATLIIPVIKINKIKPAEALKSL